ncbi:hypothetical protein FNX48_024425 [Streptomyces sp. IF17]|nr:hypothetical protein [Streptomyces alkaliphilus]
MRAVAMLAVPVMILAGVLTGPTALPVPEGDRQVIANAPLGGLPPAVAGKPDLGNPVVGTPGAGTPGAGRGEGRGRGGPLVPGANGWQ